MDISYVERRLDRRIPIGCSASILLKNGDIVPAKCVALSVAGMTIHANYVPGEAEVLDIEVQSSSPLVAQLEVKRCHAIEEDVYEIGGAIVRIVE